MSYPYHMIFRSLLFILLSFSVTICTFAQQSKPFPPTTTRTSTAPTWSAWPGEGAPLRGSGINSKWAVSGRFVDTELERPRWRFTVNCRVHQRLQLGLEYNPVAKEVSPLLSLFLLTEGENEWRPALFLGTSSDRIGSPAGKQSYFVTVSKGLPKLPISAYATLNYSEWDRELGNTPLNIPFGITVEFGQYLSIRSMYDVDRPHLMLNCFADHYGVSLMYVWLERGGISTSIQF